MILNFIYTRRVSILLVLIIVMYAVAFVIANAQYQKAAVLSPTLGNTCLDGKLYSFDSDRLNAFVAIKDPKRGTGVDCKIVVGN